MSKEMMRIEHHGLVGGFWIIGWLFSIGFVGLTFWQGVLALILWPYYLGVALSTFGA